MNPCDDSRWVGLAKNGNALVSNKLNNLAIKQIQFRSQHDQQLFRPKKIKPALHTKIFHHGYYKAQQNNKQILPDLSIKILNQEKTVECDNGNSVFAYKNFARSTLCNTRNSQILNSLIEILKNDNDHKSNSSKNKYGRIKTQQCFSNQFVESRDISSVKNSRAPKIISNEIMMLRNQNGVKRKLVSQKKYRNKTFSYESSSLNQQVYLKIDTTYDQMEMTFYKPKKGIINQIQNSNQNIQNLQLNQFI